MRRAAQAPRLDPLGVARDECADCIS